MMELFCKTNEWLKVVGYFCKKAPLYMFDRVLNTPLENTRKQLGIQQKKNPEKLFAVTGQ